MLRKNDVNVAEFLRNIDLFETLETEECLDLLRITEQFVIGAGERLFAEGDAASGMYVVERGEVEVRIKTDANRELVLAHLGNGSAIGEMSLIAGGPRSASVGAVSQTQGFFLAREAFDALRTEGDPIAFKIVLQLARTLDRRRRQLEERFAQLREDPEVDARLKEKSTKELIARVRKA
ncbi:MAG: cyclic nucleotide-binding domain-containing protein [Myxococcales bacterium]|nr:cyclic nucleotide-binding domain-containing protein [Myxococcales bacterium]